MGVDIYSGRGVIFTVDEFLKVINGKNKRDAVWIVTGKLEKKSL